MVCAFKASLPLRTRFKGLNHCARGWLLKGKKHSYTFWGGPLQCTRVLFPCIRSWNLLGSEKLRKLLKVRQQISDRARVQMQSDSRVCSAVPPVCMCYQPTLGVLGHKQRYLGRSQKLILKPPLHPYNPTLALIHRPAFFRGESLYSGAFLSSK